jgi:hypothetical protein
VRGLVVGALLLGAGAPARGAEEGLVVNPIVNDEPQKAGCTVSVYPSGSQSAEQAEPAAAVASGTAGERLEVPPGKYDVATSCNTERLTLWSFTPGVQVKAGKPTAVEVKLFSGSVIVHATRLGQRLKADVAVLFPGTNYEVARGPTSNRMELATGTYDVRVTAEVDGEISVGTVERQVVAAGKPQTVNVDMSPGTFTLVITRNGKPGEGVGALTAPGNKRRLKELTGGEPTPVAAGTYDVLAALRSSFDFSEKRQRRVTIPPGKETTLKVDLPRGFIKTRCELEGADADATVYGYLPGAEDYFNSGPCGEDLELAPGKVHLRFALDAERTGYKVLGEEKPEQWVRNVVVEKGKTRSVTADFSPARLNVTAKKNGAEVSAAVTVYRHTQGGRETLGGGPSGENLPVPPGRYDLEILYPGKRGPAKETVRNVECQARKPCRAEANLEVAVVVIEVFLGGAPETLAEVVLYKGGSVIPYVKGRSGEELEVPPGDYIPEARHGDKKRQVSKMRLRAGDAESRKVSLD